MPRCKYCKAPITFIRTERGRLMPVEPEPITVITPQGVTVKKAYIPHFANCERNAVDPDSKAAYSHWNEEAEHVYYQEHPEVFGR